MLRPSPRETNRRPQRWRLLLLVAVIALGAGILGMHVFSVAHEAHTVTPASHSHGVTSGEHADSHAIVAGAAEQAGHEAPCTSDCSSEALGMCLAILVGVALLLVGRPTGRDLAAAMKRTRVIADWARASDQPPRGPCLYELCISRT